MSSAPAGGRPARLALTEAMSSSRRSLLLGTASVFYQMTSLRPSGAAERPIHLTGSQDPVATPARESARRHPAAGGAVPAGWPTRAGCRSPVSRTLAHPDSESLELLEHLLGDVLVPGLRPVVAVVGQE